jgi:hypothetical protein
MLFRKSSSMDRTGVQCLAEKWGRIVARHVYQYLDAELDLDAENMEQMAATAARAVANEAIEELLKNKASLLSTEQPCPSQH